MANPLDELLRILNNLWTLLMDLIDSIDPLDDLQDILHTFWDQVMEFIESIDILGITDLIETLSSLQMYQVLSFLLIFGLSALFATQIYAWSTKPNPSSLNAIALGGGTGILSVIFIHAKITMIPAVLGACITGVYAWQGYVYIGGLVALLVVFSMNIWTGWKQNTPLELLQ